MNLFGAFHEQQHAHGKKTFGKSFLRVIPTVEGAWGSEGLLQPEPFRFGIRGHGGDLVKRGTIASRLDQLERLPKTASHPFTHGHEPVGVVSTGLLYISLEP